MAEGVAEGEGGGGEARVAEWVGGPGNRNHNPIIIEEASEGGPHDRVTVG